MKNVLIQVVRGADCGMPQKDEALCLRPHSTQSEVLLLIRAAVLSGLGGLPLTLSPCPCPWHGHTASNQQSALSGWPHAPQTGTSRQRPKVWLGAVHVWGRGFTYSTSSSGRKGWRAGSLPSRPASCPQPQMTYPDAPFPVIQCIMRKRILGCCWAPECSNPPPPPPPR